MTSPTKGTEGRSQVQPQVTTPESQTVVIHAGREYTYEPNFFDIDCELIKSLFCSFWGMMRTPSERGQDSSQVQRPVTMPEPQTVVIHEMNADTHASCDSGAEPKRQTNESEGRMVADKPSQVPDRKYTPGFVAIPATNVEIINQFLTDKERYFCFARLSHGHGKLSKDYLRKLTTVRLCSMPTMSSASLEKIVTLSPNLVKLNLADSTSLQTISCLSGVRHSLQDLNLSGCTGLYTFNIRDTLQQLTELRKLDIRNIAWSPVYQTKKFLSRLTALPKLYELKIDYYPCSIDYMNFPNLLCLELNIIARFDDELCQQYSEFPSLKKLEILRMKGTALAIKILLESRYGFLSLFPALKELDLTRETKNHCLACESCTHDCESCIREREIFAHRIELDHLKRLEEIKKQKPHLQITTTLVPATIFQI